MGEIWKDPIVDEVRKAREEIWKEADENLDRLFEMLQEKQKTHQHLLVRREPRKIQPPTGTDS